MRCVLLAPLSQRHGYVSTGKPKDGCDFNVRLERRSVRPDASSSSVIREGTREGDPPRAAGTAAPVGPSPATGSRHAMRRSTASNTISSGVHAAQAAVGFPPRLEPRQGGSTANSKAARQGGDQLYRHMVGRTLLRPPGLRATQADDLSARLVSTEGPQPPGRVPIGAWPGDAPPPAVVPSSSASVLDNATMRLRYERACVSASSGDELPTRLPSPSHTAAGALAAALGKVSAQSLPPSQQPVGYSVGSGPAGGMEAEAAEASGAPPWAPPSPSAFVPRLLHQTWKGCELLERQVGRRLRWPLEYCNTASEYLLSTS